MFSQDGDFVVMLNVYGGVVFQFVLFEGYGYMGFGMMMFDGLLYLVDDVKLEIIFEQIGGLKWELEVGDFEFVLIFGVVEWL